MSERTIHARLKKLGEIPATLSGAGEFEVLTDDIITFGDVPMAMQETSNALTEAEEHKLIVERFSHIAPPLLLPHSAKDFGEVHTVSMQVGIETVVITFTDTQERNIYYRSSKKHLLRLFRAMGEVFGDE